MFEVAELGHKLSKAEYNDTVPQLRIQLLQLQNQLKEADFPVIVLVSGVDGSGKGETVNLLNEWLDPRYVRTDGFGEATEEERQRPRFWRFWKATPARGHIAIYVGSWYSQPIADLVYGKISKAQFDKELIQINTFERELVRDGAVIIKIWLHLSKKQQARRMKKLEKDPKTRWRVSEQDKLHLKRYNQFLPVAEDVLRVTSTGLAPWKIVEASDARYRGVCVGQIIAEKLHYRFSHSTVSSPTDNTNPPAPKPDKINSISILNRLDLSLALAPKSYKKQLEEEQGRLNQLARAAVQQGVSSVVVLEGWDAAGKGGVIRRLVPAMDARHYHIIPVSAPTDEERAHHYLWRFWRHMSRSGDVTIYDRSWYGRVLVERVEGFARTDEWMRAYTEINDFESQLLAHGIVLAKFWIHISNDEQLRRFKAREQIPYKRHKITEEDYRNREQWDAYETAVNDMVERTSTDEAPWVLVEGNDKRYARIKTIRTFCDRLEQRVDLSKL